MSQCIKMAILGDIHFGNKSRCKEFSIPNISNHTPVLTELSFKDATINILKDYKPNYIVIPGDITSTGSPLEFRYFQRILDEIKHATALSDDKILSCLGNHDLDWRVSSIISEDLKDNPAEQNNANEAYQILSSYIANLFFKTPNFSKTGPIPYSGIIENNEIVCFVLNTAHKSCKRNDKLYYGELGLEQLEWISKSCENYSSDPRWKIMIFHHHPKEYKWPHPFKDTSVLSEGADIIDVAWKYGVDAIIHGHRHHPQAESLLINRLVRDKPLVFICTGSLSVDIEHRKEIPNSLHFLELNKSPRENDSHIILRNFEYSQGDGWIPIRKNTKITPLDPEMLFYKFISESELSSIVRSYLNESNIARIPKWRDLNFGLRSLSLESLDSLVKETFSATHDICGEANNGYFCIPKE